jgi:hypothetical protein
VANFDKVIPPGQEGKVNLVIEGNKVHGSFTKSATIHSNDPEHPVMTVTLAGNKIPYVEIIPRDRVYLQGRYGEKIEETLTVRSNEDDVDFEITALESNIDDKITYKAEPGPNPGEYQLHIWKNPKLPTLNTYGSLTLKTTSTNAPERVIQVQVVTKGAITVQPTTLNYGRIPFGKVDEDAEPVKKSVTVIKSIGQFSIENVEFDSDDYQADVQEVVPGKRYKVDVTFQPPRKFQANQREVGEMIIRTNDPKEPLLRVKLVSRAM